ncbi:LOW QUALITY PROTEIN: SERTA domain-containing protein 2-like [Aplochiton taeniatus]
MHWRPVQGLLHRAVRTQRQTVLNLSLRKLSSQRRAAEPGLQRCVLINNVIRGIQNEFKEEGGGLQALFFSVAPGWWPAAALEGGQDSHEALEASFSVFSPALSTLDSLLEDNPPLLFALPLASPHPWHHSAKDSFSSALEEIERLCPPATSDTPSSSSDTPTAKVSSSQTSMKEESKVLQDDSSIVKHAITQTNNTHTLSSPVGFLTDFALDDILLTDIESSMSDFNQSSLAPASKKGSMMKADDLVKTISTYNGGNSLNQPLKMDLAELDHIMEVLVGS